MQRLCLHWGRMMRLRGSSSRGLLKSALQQLLHEFEVCYVSAEMMNGYVLYMTDIESDV